MTPAAVPTRAELNDPASLLRWLEVDPSIDGRPSTEPGRTVEFTQIQATDATEPPADRISRLLISEERFEDTRRIVYYVLNELLRNVVQHSRDLLGGVIGAQVNWGGRSAGAPVVQVAVADAGIGIPASLQSRHTSLVEPREALSRSLWPHVSSTFDEGETGSAQNAGMGLFFIAEMTKLLCTARGLWGRVRGEPWLWGGLG